MHRYNLDICDRRVSRDAIDGVGGRPPTALPENFRRLSKLAGGGEFGYLRA